MRAVLVGAAILLGVVALALLQMARGTSLPFATDIIERRASAALGRPLTLDEAPWLELGKSTRLRLAGLRIASTDWADEAPLLSLERAEASIRLASLFSGPTIIEALSVDGLHIVLATDATGQSNLPDIGGGAPKAAREDGEALPVFLGDVTMRDVTLTRHDGETGKRLALTIAELTQVAAAEAGLQIAARGTLQERDWSLRARHSGLPSLLDGEDLWGEIDGELGTLALQGRYSLADTARLEDVDAEFELSGLVPPRVAELSPLLETADPILARVAVQDVDPGVAIDVVIDIGDTDIIVRGSADRPGSGDGLDLTINVDAGSLPRLARGLGLGAAEEMPLVIDGHIRRDGRRLEIDDFAARAGEHRIDGRLILPLLPGTTDAQVDVHARGPDFGFYQRLFARPFEANAPYAIDLVMARTADGREQVAMEVEVGTTQARIAGLLGEFPRYRNSDLRLTFEAESLESVGALFETRLPPVAVSGGADLRVSAQGRISTDNLAVHGAEAVISLVGGVDTYPDFDDLDASIQVTAPSLARTAGALGLLGLGDVPASLALGATGALDSLVLHDVTLAVAGATLRSTKGSLVLTPAGLRSDIEIDASLVALPAILGSLAPAALPDERYTFSLAPRVTPDGYQVQVHDIRGPGVSGLATLGIGRQLVIDEQATLVTDLRIDDVRRVLPPLGGFTPTAAPVRLHAATHGGAEPRIDLRLDSKGDTLLRASATLPTATTPLHVGITGEGRDLHALGSVPALPEGRLPYRIDAAFTVDEADLAVAVKDLRIGTSELAGTLHWDRAAPALTANLVVPRADLPEWLPGNRDDDEAPVQDKRKSSDGRLVPDTPLPLHYLDGVPLDIAITTGPLGLQDPVYPAYTLVDSARAHLRRSGGELTLRVDELTGVRGTFAMDVMAAREADGARVTTALKGVQIPLGILSAATRVDNLPRHTLDVSLASRGRSVRELAAHLDGELLLVGGPGDLRRMNMSFATASFLRQLFLALLPSLKDQEPDMRVQCTVLGARATAGVVALDPGFVSRTDHVDLSARGQVDLARERLAIRFDNQARKGLGISAASFVNPYVQITGSLAKPTIGLDMAGTAIAGGAAVASGGLTTLIKPLYGRFLARGNPCDVALERWKAKSGEDPTG